MHANREDVLTEQTQTRLSVTEKVFLQHRAKIAGMKLGALLRHVCLVVGQDPGLQKQVMGTKIKKVRVKK